MSNILNIHARQILDSRGIPTVEVDIITKNYILGRASIPSGASLGSYEALELRDGGDIYMGKSVFKAVDNINKIISPHLIGLSVFNQKMIDDIMIELDGTSNKSRLGANAILPISLAISKAAALELNIPLFQYFGGLNAKALPVPMINIINGGVHSDAGISFQEFMIVPVKAKSFSHAIQIGVEIFYTLKNFLRKKHFSIGLGDEGGFAPSLSGGIEEALNIMKFSVEECGYSLGIDIKIAIDCASSEFYNKNGLYDYSKFEIKNKKKLSSKEQAEYLAELSSKYSIISIEDGMDQNDWEGWKYLTNLIGDRVQLVGDDLFVTNINKLSKGIKDNVGNSILIKVNQIGTLSETFSAVKMAHNFGYTAVISHRSGETEDSIIADLSVGLNCKQIKTGSVSRSERMAKYNQLIRIEETLGLDAYYPGICAFNIKDIKKEIN